MTRPSENIARDKILQAAEKLFAEQGFDGTSVDAVSRAAGVNKALIYYYFKDKQDIILSLFVKIVQDVDQHAQASPARPQLSEKAAIRRELEFLSGKRKILSILMMESLKNGAGAQFLFQCAEKAIQHESGKSAPDRAAYVHEFFTGFLPIVLFAVYQDKWQKHYRVDHARLVEQFLTAFEETHLNSKAK